MVNDKVEKQEEYGGDKAIQIFSFFYFTAFYEREEAHENLPNLYGRSICHVLEWR